MIETSSLPQVDAGTGRGQVALDGNDQGLAPGQYVVFYQRGVCLGCATICATEAKLYN